MRSIPSVLVVLASLFAGCGSPEPTPIDPVDELPVRSSSLAARGFATGSTTLVHHRGAIWNVNPDAGTITRTELDGGAVTTVPVGDEPTRIAAQGDRILVTLRGERAVAVVSASEPDAGVLQVVHVGAEPVGIVIREDGLRAYVAVSQEDAVVELDGATFEPLRRFAVAGEPRYLALHPSGVTLYAGSGRGEARISAIDTRTGDVSALALPATQRNATGAPIPLVPRITGDLWIDPDGRSVLAPVIYGDNVTPIVEVEAGEIEPEPMPIPPPEEEIVEGYGGSGDGVDKFTPAVVEVPVGTSGSAQEGARAVFASLSVFSPNAMFGVQTVGSYLSSVTVSPDGQRWLATMQGSEAVLLMDPAVQVFSGGMMMDGAPGAADPAFMPGIPSEGPLFTMPEEGGFIPVATAVMTSGPGVDGAVFVDTTRAIANVAFDGALDDLRLQDAEWRVVESAAMGMNMPELLPRGVTRQVSVSPLDVQIRQGRQLFYSAMDTSMGAGGISCATCHFEGRNDGITWTFESGVRQTPSLAGVVSETAPVTWTADVESVAMEADLTSRGRMGGSGLSPVQLEAIAAYVDWSREVDVPLKGETAGAVARGKAIFERSDVGCASCHSGDRFTDNQGHTIRGVENLNTPGLRGVAATGPYLHDGSAPNLRTVLEWARSGVMGDTSSLSSAEMDDLEAYLRSL